jgi:hypothetical protein
MSDTDSRLLELLKDAAYWLYQWDDEGNMLGMVKPEDMDPETRKGLELSLTDLACFLVQNADRIHVVDAPQVVELYIRMLPDLREQADEYLDRDAIHQAIDELVDDYHPEWEERAWDFLPAAVRRPPNQEAQRVYQEMVRAYLIGLDLAAIGLARATLERIVDARWEEGGKRTRRRRSAWAKDNYQPPRGKKPTESRMPHPVLYWKIEDLFYRGLLTERTCAAAHELRELGNDALHAAKGDREIALGAIERFRVVLCGPSVMSWMEDPSGMLGGLG